MPYIWKNSTLWLGPSDYMATETWVNMGSGNGLLPVNGSSEGLVAFIWGQILQIFIRDIIWGLRIWLKISAASPSADEIDVIALWHHPCFIMNPILLVPHQEVVLFQTLQVSQIPQPLLWTQSQPVPCQVSCGYKVGDELASNHVGLMYMCIYFMTDPVFCQICKMGSLSTLKSGMSLIISVVGAHIPTNLRLLLIVMAI